MIHSSKRFGNINIINSVNLDLVLCMTVNPGFGGQSFIHDVLEKVEKLAVIRDNISNNYTISTIIQYQ